VVLLAGGAARTQVFQAEQLLISSAPGGVSADGDSTGASISLDGTTVAFQSTATNLSPLDGDRIPDVYVGSARGEVLLVSLSSDPQPVKGDGPSILPSMSANGRLVLFTSTAKNLVPEDGNGHADVFVRDLGARTTVLASVSRAGVQGDDVSDFGVLSADGRRAAFSSRAGNLAGPAAGRGIYRIHVRDLAGAATTRIDLPGGQPADRDCLQPDLSRDGRWVVFHSASGGFDDRDAGDLEDVFLHDLVTSQTVRVSALSGRVPPDGPSSNARISASGRFVAFESLASNLVVNDANRVADVFLRDMLTGAIERVSLDDRGEEAKLESSTNDVSADGRFVLFETLSALVPEDQNDSQDVYARDRLRSRTFLVSAALRAGVPAAAGGDSEGGTTNADGLLMAFSSTADDLSPQDQSPNADVYLLRLERQPEGPFPPSNHVLINSDGLLRQLDLQGMPTGRTLGAVAVIEGVAIDEANALWVVAGGAVRRFQAFGLEPLAGGPFQLPAGSVHDIAAAGGFAWVAAGDSIARVGGEGSPIVLPLPGRPEAISIALDGLRHLWVSAAHDGFHELLELSRDLKLLNAVRRASPDPFRDIAADARGDLRARSRRSLARLAPAGGVLWSVSLLEGRGVECDAAGNAYTFAGPDVVGFRPDGASFLRTPHGGGATAGPGSRLAVDGEGHVWVLVDGARGALRFDPRAKPVLVDALPAPILEAQPVGDPTGFVTADVSAQRGDMDGDGFLNRDETLGRFNPFAPNDPPALRRLKPVIDLVATSIGGRRVRLDWTSAEPYAFFHVFRDRRPIAGSPFRFADAPRGVVDTQVPGGLHTYRVVGQGLEGRGGGAGLGFSEDDIEEPFSITTEESITLGEGGLLAFVNLDVPPDAVAHDAAASRILVLLEGGVLLTLDEGLAYVSDVTLPAVPFASTEVRGMAVDGAAPDTPLYLLLGDGRVFQRVGAGDPVLDVTLSDFAPAPAGFTGLAIADDLFATMAGPDLDCLIGFFRTTGAHAVGADTSLSATLGQPVAVSVGLTRIAGGLLAGSGNGIGTSTIEQVAKLGLALGFAVSDAASNLPLGALESTDIAGFDYAPGLGLIVADRSGSRVAILEATFPGSIKLLSVSPERGRYNTTTVDVEITATGLPSELADICVGFDGFAVSIKVFDAGTGTLTVDAEAPGRPLAVEVEVFSSTGFDSFDPGFTFGFERGDANDDVSVDISDALRIFNYLFSEGAAPPCPDAADVDDSESIQITDAIRLLDFLFRGLAEPPAPFPTYGLDPDGEELGCGEE
jgi:Tol biopolymer transport system component